MNFLADPCVQLVLAFATILGGIAAVVFFWDKITSRLRQWFGPAGAVGPRPLLVHSVELHDIGIRYITLDVQLADLVLVIENKGELIAENHVPELVIEVGTRRIFDNRQTLAKASVVGEIAPGKSVALDMYRMLHQPISTICDDIRLMGFPVVLNREFTIKAHSTYTSPGGTPAYDTATYQVKFRWFQKDAQWGPVLTHVQTATYTRVRI